MAIILMKIIFGSITKTKAVPSSKYDPRAAFILQSEVNILKGMLTFFYFIFIHWSRISSVKRMIRLPTSGY